MATAEDYPTLVDDESTVAISTARALLKSALDAGVFSGRPARIRRFLFKFAMTSLDHQSCSWDETAFRYDDGRAEVKEVIAKAEAGDADADRSLRDAAIPQLPNGLPPHLAKYIGGRLADGDRRWRHGSGKFDRDVCIYYVVEKIAQMGFQHTRNSATDSDSACSIVAKVLTEFGALKSSEKNIERVWGKVQSTIPALQKRRRPTKSKPRS
jgi:hypothetical protein